MWNNGMGFNSGNGFPQIPGTNPPQQVSMPMWGGWGVGQGPMMAPPFSMPMMVVPGAHMQPPQFGWMGQQQQQQQMMIQPNTPRPTPPANPQPPPPPPPHPTSAKPLFPGLLNENKPPPPPGAPPPPPGAPPPGPPPEGPNLSSPPPPPPSESKPNSIIPGSGGKSTFQQVRNLEGLSAPPPPPPPDEGAEGGRKNQNLGVVGGNRSAPSKESRIGAQYGGEDSEYDHEGGDRNWNGAKQQSRWGGFDVGGGGGGWQEEGHVQDSGSSSLSPGTWRCEGCNEVNFQSRTECKRCGLLEADERANKLKSFDKMFDTWNENYHKWKVSNESNPDREYVANYSAQMEAMRHQLLDKRKAIHEGRPQARAKPTANFGKRMLEEEMVQQKKKSRWEENEDLDIEVWRRPKQTEEEFWKPKAVKDYSQQGGPRRTDQEFRPAETFDYSQREGSNRNWGPSRPPLGPGPRPWAPSRVGRDGNSFDRSSHSPSSTNVRGRGGGGSPMSGRPGPPPRPSGSQVRVDSLVQLPGRLSRPPRLAVILRGLPGAGKSHVAKLLKEKEVEQGADAPRTMALDDYFDCDGEYEYEAEMEPAYRGSLEKSFKKNVDGGLFPFLIVDAINEKVEHFRGMWSHAKQNGFEVYICDVDCDINTASDRNIHGRTLSEVKRLSDCWEKTPDHMNTLDIRTLLQDDAIEHVDMEEEPPKMSEKTEPDTEGSPKPDDVDEENSNEGIFLSASKWEVSDNEARMAKLDGTTEKVKSKLAQHTSIEDWLELGEDYNKPDETGKKRVRWADIEEKKSQARREKMGFVVGGRNWASQSDRESCCAWTCVSLT